MENRFVYHYCAQYQIGSAIYYLDGIAQLGSKVTCHDDYAKLKQLIEPVEFKRLTITNFTFFRHGERIIKAPTRG